MGSGFELYRAYSRDAVTHHVTLYRQARWRQAWAWIYHEYDMRIHKVPGVRLVDGLIDTWRARRTPVESWLPVDARRDLRCWRLSRAGRTDVITFDLDEDTYIRLGGQPR